MEKLLSKLPVDYKDLTAVAMFVVAVALAVMVAKRLPVLGKQL